MAYDFKTDVVIGLEIHAELNTDTKLFCSCSRTSCADDMPNTRVCPICLGHPGTRPMLNKKALDYAIKLCLAVGSRVADENYFSRKSYFYPDMSKNFQITQFKEPLGAGGKIMLKSRKKITLTRIHIEEDPASITYPGTMQNSEFCYIDYNRCGNPLVEIVTEPELHSPQEARDFLNRLISILSYLKIFDINKCIIKADANISLKESNYTRVEIKNITGFKELERALNYEITRQRTILKRGLKIRQETRGWDDSSKTTKLQRIKETEDDYGYIIEPDLTITDITSGMIDSIKKSIPELAHQKARRYAKEFGIDPVDADVISSELELAEFFERAAEKIEPVLAARWIRRELLRVLNYSKKTIRDIEFGDEEMCEILMLIKNKEISETTGQKLMEMLMEKKFSPKEYAEKNNLKQVSEESELKLVCEKVIKENKKAVDDYFAGEKKAFQYLIGQVMRETKGKAEPAKTNRVLKEAVDKIR